MVELEQSIRSQVMEQMDMSRDITDEEIVVLIQKEICNQARNQNISIPRRLQLQNNIFNSLRKLDVLQELLEDEDITEIMINGYQKIFIEKDGKIQETGRQFSSREKLNDVIQQIVAASNKIVNESTPIVDTRLYDGSRVNIVLPPASVDESILSIRKFPKNPITMKRLLQLDSLSQEMADQLKLLVQSGYNIFISGGTGSGKTTFLNALAEYIPKGERVITIEDSAELQLEGVDNLVRLEARNALLDGNLEITIRDLVRT